jgi:hypothetical protein
MNLDFSRMLADTFLLQYKEICALHGPSKHDVSCLREWLERPKCGDNFLSGVVNALLLSRIHLPDRTRSEIYFILEMIVVQKTSARQIL